MPWPPTHRSGAVCSRHLCRVPQLSLGALLLQPQPATYVIWGRAARQPHAETLCQVGYEPIPARTLAHGTNAAALPRALSCHHRPIELVACTSRIRGDASPLPALRRDEPVQYELSPALVGYAALQVCRAAVNTGLVRVPFVVRLCRALRFRCLPLDPSVF